MINKKLLYFLIILVLVLISLIIWGVLALNSKHKEEINKVIYNHNGKIISINKVNKEQSPFKDSSSGNVIYKVLYTINNKKYIAWYRATKTLNDIHAAGPKDFPEQWIFNENP